MDDYLKDDSFLMNKERHAMLEMLLCAILWSLSGVLTKLVDWNAFVISAGRSVCAGIIVFIYMRHIGLKPVLNKRSFLLGLCIVIIFMCYLPALKLTTSANAIVLQYTAPVYVLLLSALIYKRKVWRGDIIAVLMAVGGIALCFINQLGGGSPLGNILGLCSGVFLAGMFLLSGDYDERERLSGIFIAQILAVLVGLPFIFTTSPVFTVRSILLVVLQGVIQLGIPYILYSRAMRYCPPLTCSLISVIEPLLNPVWVFLAVGESPGILSFIGSIIVLVTITAWSVWNEKKKQDVDLTIKTEDADGV